MSVSATDRNSHVGLEKSKPPSQMDEEGEIGEEESEQYLGHSGLEKSHLRRHQNSLFDSWCRKLASNVDLSIVKTSYQKNQAQSVQSINQLLKTQESRKIIGSEYTFQLELFEHAKLHNTIVVVDTGAGKTLVAMLLLKHIVDQDIEVRITGAPRKIAFFLVEKVTLMLQQYFALCANLPFRIINLCGAYNTDIWTRDKWREILESTDIIVCTADILLHSLTRAFIRMSQINLLIFDEAHHAKKGHAYARIMRDFYDDEVLGEAMPRIFGMTASPIDVLNSDDIEDCVSDLELTLHAKIATRSDEDAEDQRSKPIEEVVCYSPSPHRFETPFQQTMKDAFRALKGFHQLFTKVTEINNTLGPWCGDAYWTLAFSDRELNKFTARADKAAVQEHPENSNVRLMFEKEAADLRSVHEKIQAYQLKVLTPSMQDLNQKVLCLRDCLLRHFERPTDSRCLVFVSRRETAKLLHMVFDQVGSPHMKCGCLVGSSTADFEGQRYTFRQQVLTIQSFRKGVLNCLFATPVAEEGLDIPDCNLVIRFDPCNTMIQYVQSRGRARHKNSRFVHLQERDNWEEQDRLEDIHQCEIRMKTFCRNLPKEQRLASEELDDEEMQDKHRFPTFLIPSTGAKLTYPFSLLVLNHYVSMLPQDEFDDTSIRFVVFIRDGNFVCEVNLPERANISPVVGRPYSTKVHAKMSAAFEVCKLLRKQRLLDDNLLPIYVSQLHKMRGARLAIKSSRQQAYEMRLKPTFWSRHRGSIPTYLFLTILRLEDGWDRPVRPFGLLTRQILPQLPTFPLYTLSDTSSTCRLIMSNTSIPLDGKMLSQLTWFTLTIFKDIFNKTFEENPESMPYWIAPLSIDKGRSLDGFPDLPNIIDWALLQSTFQQNPLKWEAGMSDAGLIQKFLIDPWDGGRRLFTEEIAMNYHPLDDIPEDVAVGPRHATNILEYSSSLSRQSKLRRAWKHDQPVLTAHKVLHRLNVLDVPTEKEQQTTTRCFVCPEPLDISHLPLDVASMGLVFPAVIHRIESYLIALEFCETLDLSIKPELALEAVTKDSDNSGDMRAEKVNFQRGMGSNYERLEFIGDTFLKMATSISTFIRNVGKDEHWMHVDRMTLICNANMFDNARRNGFPKYIRSKAFSRRTWYPPGLNLLKGKGANKKDSQESSEQALSDKTIADVCEAMIGAALVSHVETGYESSTCFDDAVKAVSAFVSSPEHQEHTMQFWGDYSRAYRVPKYQTANCAISELEIAKHVEKVHRYVFKHTKLLTSAFTHPSCGNMYAKAPSYQRLEFLGDALLDMTAVKHLFFKHPDKDPQWMTEHKMAMVSNKFMGALGAQLGFNRFLNHNSASVRAQMTVFIEEFESARKESGTARNFWEALKDPPKCLADMVEAYVGAMFVDSDFDFRVVQGFFDSHIRWFFEDMRIYDGFANNSPINKLQEFLQTSMGCKRWRVMARENPSDDESTAVTIAGVMIHSSIVSQAAIDRSSRVAKMLAAKEAYEALHGLAPFQFRERFQCTCTTSGDVDEEMSEQGDLEDTAI